MIEAVRYSGLERDANDQLDAQTIRGPLDEQIRQAMAFLRRNQVVSARKSPHRVETPQFSERAVFEAVVNAVAHRDYSIHASKIRFFMFHDRLEIYSPGGLINTLTVESLPLRQATRNELITRLLSECPSHPIGGGKLVCRDAADFNEDASVDMSDPIAILNALFAGGPTPPERAVLCAGS
jgi:predicted HTH transcriptional regulator